MQRRTLASGAAAVAAVVGLGAGGLAIAESGTAHAASPSASKSKPASSTGHARNKRRLIARVLHGQLVLRSHHKTVTLDLQRGLVSAVSPTSITVKSIDGVQRTYVVTSATKVRAHQSTIAESSIAVGDRVFVTALQDSQGQETARAIRGVRAAKTTG